MFDGCLSVLFACTFNNCTMLLQLRYWKKRKSINDDRPFSCVTQKVTKTASAFHKSETAFSKNGQLGWALLQISGKILDRHFKRSYLVWKTHSLWFFTSSMLDDYFLHQTMWQKKFEKCFLSRDYPTGQFSRDKENNLVDRFCSSTISLVNHKKSDL